MFNSVEDLRDAILQLTPGERARLMAEVGPDLCRSVMANPALMMEMMPKCQEMMKDPEIMKAMRPMMERMMQGMMPGGAPGRSA
jgi:hypothetical protein